MDEGYSIIHTFLTSADFIKEGANQYFHDKHGRIHLYKFTVSEVVEKLMSLGAAHRTNEIKTLLEIKEDFTFQPTA